MNSTSDNVLQTFFFDNLESDDSDSDYSSDGESLIRSHSSSSSCAEVPYIIAHILEDRRVNTELPLRAMFSFNSGQGVSKLRDIHDLWQSDERSKKIMRFFASIENKTSSSSSVSQINATDRSTQLSRMYSELHSPYDRFMDDGNDEFWSIKSTNVEDVTRRASHGLPPAFVEKMVLSTIFQSSLEDVDFTKALAGLDYIRDFEETRRCYLREAGLRLQITGENWRQVLGNNKRALEWIEDVLEQESRIETHYKSVFINLRLWTMIHEMKAKDLYKPNVLAMLNTLFPPQIDNAASMPVKTPVMHQHRARLYHCLIDIEHQPFERQIEIMDTFARRYMGVGTGFTWKETRDHLESYMKMATVMMRQAQLVHSIKFFERTAVTTEQDIRSRATSTLIPSSHLDESWASTNKTQRRTSAQEDTHIVSIPKRNPLRSEHVSSKPQPFNHQTRPKPRFRARCYSDSTILPPKQIREASTVLGALLVIPTTDLQKMILAAIKNAMAIKKELSPRKQILVGKPSSVGLGIDGITRPSSGVKLKARLDYISVAPGVSFSDDLEMAPVKHRRTKAAMLPPPLPRRSRTSSNSSTQHRLSGSMTSFDIVGMGSAPGGLMPGHIRKSSSSSDKSLKLAAQANFVSILDRTEREAEAYVDARFPNYHHHRIPPLQAPPLVTRSRNDSVMDERTWSRNTSFATRPSTSLSQRDKLEDYWPSPTISSARFANYEHPAFGGSTPDMQRFDAATPGPPPSQRVDSFESQLPLMKSKLKKQRSLAFMSRPSFTSERHGKADQPAPRSPMPERAMTSMGFRPSPDTGDLLQESNAPLKKQRSFNLFPSRRVKKKPEPPPLLIPYAMPPPPSPSIRPPLSPYNPNADVRRGRTLRRKISGQLKEARRSLSLTTRSTSEVHESQDDVFIARPYTSMERTAPSPLIGQTITKISSADSDQQLHKTKSASSLRSLFRKKSKEVIVTSDDIEEPFPSFLRESMTKHQNNSMPDLRSQAQRQRDLHREEAQRAGWWVSGYTGSLTDRYAPISDEPYEEFQRKEYARKWFLEEAKAKKNNQSVPRQRPSWEDEMSLHGPTTVLKEKQGGVKKAFGKKAGEGKLVKRNGNEAAYGNGNVYNVAGNEVKRPVLKKASTGFLGLGFGSKKREEGKLA